MKSPAACSPRWAASGPAVRPSTGAGSSAVDSVACLCPPIRGSDRATGWTRSRRGGPAADPVADWIYRLEWPEVPRGAADDGPAPSGPWLVLGGPRDAQEPVLRALSERGCEGVAVADVADARERAAAWRGIVYLGGLEAVVEAEASPTAVGEVTHRALAPVLALARAQDAAAEPAPVWIVTRGACAIDDEAADVQPAQTTLWGMGRVFALEHPEAWGGLLDLDPHDDPAAWGEASEFDALVDEVLTPRGDDQLAFRSGHRRAARLVRAPVDGDAPAVSIAAEGCTLVTGGLGELGSRLATWLVERGARHLLLTGRRGRSTPGADDVLESLRARGARVEVAAVDVADHEAMEALVSTHEPPIRGIIHAAGVERLLPLAQTDEATLREVLRPKVLGGWSLHRLTAERPLDFFVSFTSGAGIWGATTRGAYAAANAFLDGLAHHRRARDRAALSIAWGMWAEGGMGDPARLDRLRTIGVLAVPTAPALSAMERLLSTGATQRTVARMDWDRFAPIYAARPRRRLLASLVRAAPTAESAALAPRRWQGQSAEEIRPQLVASVRQLAAEVLGFDDPSDVDDTRGFADQGLDSLMAVQLRGRLQRALDLTLSSTVALDHPTVPEAGRSPPDGGPRARGSRPRERSPPRRPRRADRRRRHGVPAPGRRRGSGRVLAAPGARGDRDRRDSGGSLERGGPLRSGAGDAGPDLRHAGGLPARDRGLRAGLLPHLPARGPDHRSAAAADARAELGGPRARGPGSRGAARERHRGVRRGRAQRVRGAAGRGRRAGERAVPGDGVPAELHGGARLVRAGAARAEHRGGDRLLLVAGRRASGLPELARGRVRARDRGRRQRAAVAALVRGDVGAPRALGGRSLQDVRGRRGRLRARRGLRGRGAQAAARRGARRGSRIGADPRHRRQPRRAEQRADGAQRAGAAGPDPRRGRAGRTSPRPRSTSWSATGPGPPWAIPSRSRRSRRSMATSAPPIDRSCSARPRPTSVTSSPPPESPACSSWC